MKLLSSVRTFLSYVFRRVHMEREMEDEFRSHLALRAAELERQGLSSAEALRQARIEFGGYQKYKEECREALGTRLLQELWQDVHYSLRQLRRNPGFTIVAVLTLALGIGANTAIFSMVNGIVLSSLPYLGSQQLYVINEDVPEWKIGPWGPYWPVNAGNFSLWQRECPAFSSMALIGPATFNLTGQGIPRQVNGDRVSADFFSMIGVNPQLGRAFLPKEDELGDDQEVILSARFWREVFQSNPRIIGRSITLDNTAYTVVGIMPESFRFPDLPQFGMSEPLASGPELFTPIGLRSWERQPGLARFNFEVIARLKSRASAHQALAQLNLVEANIARKGDPGAGVAPGEVNLQAFLRPLKTVIVGPARRALWMLMIAAGFVLLIICVNLANLLSVRNVGRAHEIAVRSALGATARRLARQFLVEGLILAAGGGGIGLLLAVWGLKVLVWRAPVSIPRLNSIRVDPAVLVFTLAVSILAALLFALFPALRLARVRSFEALKSAGRTASGSRESARTRSGLVVGQIALCGVLLAGALLLIESLRHVVRANQWMDERGVLAADLAIPPDETHSTQQVGQFLSEVLEKVRALPGVRSAGFSSKLPLLGQSFGDDIDFREAPHPPNKPEIGEFRFVSPGYFQAVGLPLARGRLLSESDSGKGVALISESVARELLDGRNPIGMHLLWSGQGAPKPLEVIGEVADVRTASDEPPVMAVYVPTWTYYQRSETLVVRTVMNPSAMANSVRRAVWSVDPQVAIPRERTLNNVVSASEASRRYETLLGTVFAAFAVLLAAIGLYGVISFSVTQRTHEMGIRLALGARPMDILKLVVLGGLQLVFFGIVSGILGALALTRSLSGFLVGVKADDPEIMALVAVVLAVVGFVASYIPARRAAKVDPMVALKYE